MRKTNNFDIDGDKLRNALVKRDLKAGDTSESLGKNRTYLAQCASYGYMNTSIALLLETMYGIPRSEYEYVEPAPEPEPEPVAEEPATPSAGIDYIALYNVIYAAVYAALKANAKDLHDHLFDKEAS